MSTTESTITNLLRGLAEALVPFIRADLVTGEGPGQGVLTEDNFDPSDHDLITTDEFSTLLSQEFDPSDYGLMTTDDFDPSDHGLMTEQDFDPSQFDLLTEGDFDPVGDYGLVTEETLSEVVAEAVDEALTSGSGADTISEDITEAVDDLLGSDQFRSAVVEAVADRLINEAT